jgi:hypothetical protein
MTDPNLPPERSLDDDTKARMRATLTEATGSPSDRKGAPAWLVPLVAAAAVVGIALGGVSLLSGGDNDGRQSNQPGQPHGSGSANDPTGARSDEATMPTESPNDLLPQQPCDDAVADQLNGATELTRIAYAAGTTHLYGTESKWVVCDDWAATSDGGAPTLIGNARFDAPESKDTFAVSMNFSMNDDKAAQYFSGGPLIDGVTRISYAFPGGDVQEATMNDDMWSMVYLPRSGPMVGNRLPTDPIVVTVTHAGGATSSYDLTAPMDWCAQLNHGC